MTKRKAKFAGVDAVDLFCGGGGLTCGLRQAGIDVRMGIDYDDRCRYAYEHNNAATFLPKSVTDISARWVASRVSSHKFFLADGKGGNGQGAELAVRHTESFHNRFLIVDGRELYLLGASLKELGRKCFAFTKLEVDIIFRIKKEIFRTDLHPKKEHSMKDINSIHS